MGCGSSVPVIAAKAAPQPRGRPPAKQSQEVAQQLQAARVIQEWFRRLKAKIELRRLVSWQVFTHLEFHDEQEQVSFLLHFLFKNNKQHRHSGSEELQV